MNYNFETNKVKSLSPAMMVIPFQFLTTTAGTISGTPLIPGGGATIAKTGATTGRYTITLVPGTADPGLGNLIFFGGVATILGPDTGALTTTKGTQVVFRRDDISQVSIRPTSGKDGTIEMQFVQSNAGNADTELEDGAAVCGFIVVGFTPMQ